MPAMTKHRGGIAAATVAIVERGGYASGSGRTVDIADAVRLAVAGTRLYLPEAPLPAGTAAPGPGRVEVTNKSSLAATRRLHADGRQEAVACLNFASAKNPGGGFLRGADAQEESLARASALYACLRAAPDFYAFHRAQGDLRYSDRVIYFPGVPVFRDDHGRLLDSRTRSPS
jgi:uncharacterized protein (TIGR02452 family)